MSADPGGLLTVARERFAAREYYGALLCLDELIAGGHAYADVHHLRGLSLSLLHREEEAIQAFDRALALNPRYLEAHIHRGLVLNHLGRTEEAAQAFAAAAASEGAPVAGLPGSVAARLANEHARLGELYAGAQVLDEAVREYRRAVMLGPGFIDLRFRLARLLLEAGNPLLAIEELEAILSERPQWVDARLQLGLARYLSGDVASATAIWQACRAEAPDAERVQAYLAMVERLPS